MILGLPKHIVVFTGAGISAESGLKTFRDAGGLWEGYRVEEVATPEAWRRDPELVLKFYNERRRQVVAASPNKAHLLIAELEKKFHVTVITQNVDDLHERAGSTNVLHLHGEIRKSQSTKNIECVYGIEGTELSLGDMCPDGGQLRPFIVWFGEAVPMYEKAANVASTADIAIVVGTSLQVYPAAGLIDELRNDVPVYLVDPKPASVSRQNVFYISDIATAGMSKVIEMIGAY